MGDNHLDTAESMKWLGYLLHSSGKADEALPHLEKSLVINSIVVF
ncbi:tetratricopeptide repeat protein [Chloroflexi bacterium TSY]|nr:tetratricopeptide repeat protein [Chloroflexi bacterium TSY]